MKKNGIYSSLYKMSLPEVIPFRWIAVNILILQDETV